MPRYVFVLGGGYSGLGKGIVTASIARLLQNYGFDVKTIKVDPYFNLGAGDQNPNEHGEVFVTEDGGEIDQDFGHYERFLAKPCKSFQNITSGKVYKLILENERNGKYLGKTVQLIPHVRDVVKDSIRKAAGNCDIAVVEIGGTIGDDEALIFMRAINSMINEDNEKCAIATLVPIVFNEAVGEPKTKIAQLAIRSLNELGINSDFLIARTEYESFLDEKRKKKIHIHCNIKPENIISDPNMDIVYRLPFVFYDQKFGKKILEKIELKPNEFNWNKYDEFIKKYDSADGRIPIAYVGKYVKDGEGIHKDAYISVEEAIKRAFIEFGVRPEIHRIDATNFDPSILKKYYGIIVPGGYGSRGFEGKIEAIKFARENNIPFLGLCLGLQLAVVEFARNVCNIRDAKTDEMDEENGNRDGEYVVSILKDQENIRKKNGYFGTQRLGDFATIIQSDFIKNLYIKIGRPDEYEKEKLKTYEKIRTGILKDGDFVVFERHRHRREVNPDYHDILIKNGMEFSGIHRTLDNTILVEIIRLPNHPFFVASQFHPEFTSNYLKPNPLFYGFAEAVTEKFKTSSQDAK